MISLYESITRQKREFIIIKPGFEHLYLEIVNILKYNHIIVSRELRRVLTFKDAQRLYSPHRKEKFYTELCHYMSSDDSIGMMCVNYGETDMKKIKDMIRKKYGKDDMRNVIHSSDPERLATESKIYFAE